jgi:integrase
MTGIVRRGRPGETERLRAACRRLNQDTHSEHLAKFRSKPWVTAVRALHPTGASPAGGLLSVKHSHVTVRASCHTWPAGRVAHASHAIDNGAPITLVSATLGHSDLKTTSVYAHARPGRVRAGI